MKAVAAPRPAARKAEASPGRPALHAGAGRTPVNSAPPLAGRCACEGACPRCAPPPARSLASPPKAYPLASPGMATTAAEAQADRIAQAMSPGPASAASGEAPLDGTPLPSALRSFYEPRFGRSLAALRLHSGPQAAAQAASVGAHAYTIGGHIVLGRDRPARPSRTMAHEIAHALHHEPSVAWREPYETRGFSMSRTDLDPLATRGYWMERTQTAYLVTQDPRMSSDAEERDAVLSVVWTLKPTPSIRSREEMVVPIAPRTLPPPASAPGGAPGATGGAPAAPTQTATTIYRIVFEPAASGDPRPRLTLEHVFSGQGPGMTPVAAPAAPAGFTPPNILRWSFANFDGDTYFGAHPQEQEAILHWVQTTAPASFSQLLTVQSTGRGGVVTHRGVIHVSGSHGSTDINSLTYTQVSESALAATATAPADYRGRGDAGDAQIEALSGRTTQPLGRVTLPATIPADEVVPVKIYVAGHFRLRNSRSSEIDMLVPIGTGSRNVMYTVRFDASANATVTRLGEVGTGTGMTDIARVTVRRARGFPTGGNAAALRSFWSTRYAGAPTLTVAAAATDAEVLADMDRMLAVGITNTSWFQTVYGIEVMTAAATSTRLDTVHSVPATQRADTIDFDGTDLQMLELALQTLSPSELTRLRGIKLGRKTAPITRGSGGYSAGGANQYGLTLQDGTNTTVLYFGPLYLNNATLFRGSTAANALPDVVMNVLHELGHASGYQGSLEAAFTTWLTARRADVATELRTLRGQRPRVPADIAAAEGRQAALGAPTWYAATGADEMFPEVWALYHTDPHFLCGQAPLIYAWLDTLATTGAPPAATATVTARASCPA